MRRPASQLLLSVAILTSDVLFHCTLAAAGPAPPLSASLFDDDFTPYPLADGVADSARPGGTPGWRCAGAHLRCSDAHHAGANGAAASSWAGCRPDVEGCPAQLRSKWAELGRSLLPPGTNRIVEPIRQWAAEHLNDPAYEGGVVVYPFGGPDLLHPLALMPGTYCTAYMHTWPRF